MARNLTFCLDRGGTFLDGLVFEDATERGVIKILSVDPKNYPDAPTEGIRRLLELATGESHPRGQPIDTRRIKAIRMGTTVATNALLERKGERHALLVTKGFRDLLQIGNQARPHIFDLKITAPDVLYAEVVEVDERVTLADYTHRPDALGPFAPPPDATDRYARGRTGEWIEILKPIDLAALKQQLHDVYARGIRSLAVVLLHAYTFTQHEKAIEALATEIGFTQISLSSEISPTIKVISRGQSATVDAYLDPCIKRYLASFFEGFDAGIRTDVKVDFMKSDGGLVSSQNLSGIRSILSGPAAGVVGYARTSYIAHDDGGDPRAGKPVIGLDVGGTSTDVSRYAGTFEHVYEMNVSGVTIQAPQLDINTVAAGGGSRLFYRNGMFVVGPESTAADPGPVCYRKGGNLAVTDANLYLGRLVPEFFPKIFGPGENEPLDVAATASAFETLGEEIGWSAQHPSDAAMDAMVYGFIKVANEAMCRPIRALTQAKGHEPGDHILATFGGAGAQHAVSIARSLGIEEIIVHRHSSILSAYGLSLADVIYETSLPAAAQLSEDGMAAFTAQLDALAADAEQHLAAEGFAPAQITCHRFLNLRYRGTSTTLMTLVDGAGRAAEIAAAFQQLHEQEFGFTQPHPVVLVDDFRVRAIAKSPIQTQTNWLHQLRAVEADAAADAPAAAAAADPIPVTSNPVYFEECGRVATGVYLLKQLPIGTKLAGPALILDANATIVVEPNSEATILPDYVHLRVLGQAKLPTHVTDASQVVCDPIRLGVFSHRFMGIAEQMGRRLQLTAISVNIKERLDFSCAIFDPTGGLVANAPSIPVHLGAMQEAVRWQMDHHRGQLRKGDVLMSNHPAAGGSHLPDVTVITPVFVGGEVAFCVASRGHHADIGGIMPGSMPPFSRELYQEGAAFKTHLLVRDGHFDEAGVIELFRDKPAQYPGCSGSRALGDLLSDLRAQVAANQRGIVLVYELVATYGLPVVQAYMRFIQENAAEQVQRMLVDTVKRLGRHQLRCQDFMDDGSPIQVEITIDAHARTACFDFAGTGSQVYGNINAPRAVCYSAIIYCLRSLVDMDMPLNNGCFKPITVKIPEHSLLSPDENCAVVGGNVVTSQRLCDVILRAFEAAADSQGCCNNLTFGKTAVGTSAGGRSEGFGYYETIAGGHGAGPSWHGKSGYAIHMTNTRITDVETFEKHYPVIIRRFGLRPGSGGDGAFRGGNGVVREFEFREDGLEVGILSERRVYAPHGMHGGGNAQRGLNLLLRHDAATGAYACFNLGSRNAVVVNRFDRVRIETPGGGGWGCPSEAAPAPSKAAASSDAKGDAATPILEGIGSVANWSKAQHSA